MGRITFTAEEQHEDIIEDVLQEIDAESTAGAVRECIERAAAMQQRDAELQQRIEELERENQRLKNEKRTIIQQREEHTELVNTVERQQSLAERKASAGVLTRAKWWLVGMDDEKGDRG